jgi:hypothetical protein
MKPVQPGKPKAKKPAGKPAAKKDERAGGGGSTMAGSSGPPPGGPPPTGSAGGGDEEHQRLVHELQAMVDRALDEAGLSEHRREEYRASVRTVLGRMTPAAVARLNANVKGIRFYNSFQTLTAGYKAKYPDKKVPDAIQGAFDPDGVLHLDGGGVLYGRPNVPVEEFYAHEFTHALDGVGHDISEHDPAWRAAWEREIRDTLFFGPNGAKNVREGLAEFGQYLLGDLRATRRIVRQVLRACLKVWEDQGL